MRESVRINEDGFEAFLGAYEPGRTAAEVMAPAEELFVERGCGRLTMNMVLIGPEFAIAKAETRLGDFVLPRSRSPGRECTGSRSHARSGRRRRTRADGRGLRGVPRGGADGDARRRDGPRRPPGRLEGLHRARLPPRPRHRPLDRDDDDRAPEDRRGGRDGAARSGMVLSMHPHAIAADGRACLYMQDTWLVGRRAASRSRACRCGSSSQSRVAGADALAELAALEGQAAARAGGGNDPRANEQGAQKDAQRAAYPISSCMVILPYRRCCEAELMPQKGDLTRRLAVARGDEPADLVVRGGRVLSVFTREWLEADVAICDGMIAGLGDVRGRRDDRRRRRLRRAGPDRRAPPSRDVEAAPVRVRAARAAARDDRRRRRPARDRERPRHRRRPLARRRVRGPAARRLLHGLLVRARRRSSSRRAGRSRPATSRACCAGGA